MVIIFQYVFNSVLHYSVFLEKFVSYFSCFGVIALAIVFILNRARVVISLPFLLFFNY